LARLGLVAGQGRVPERLADVAPLLAVPLQLRLVTLYLAGPVRPLVTLLVERRVAGDVQVALLVVVVVHLRTTLLPVDPLPTYRPSYPRPRTAVP